MSDGALPQWVNTRKAVGREASYLGVLGAVQLPEFAKYIDTSNAAAVDAEVSFGRDDEDRQVVDVRLVAQVRLECQRCLEPFACELRSHSRLALVTGDEQAKQLPADYEPLLAAEETDLWAVVAEELALALPVVAYHPDGGCTHDLADSASGEMVVGDAQRSGPFDVLSSLLEAPGDGTDSNE
jgi:uncharacterized protein